MTIKSEIEALRSDGLIVAEVVVDWAARHPKSDLHPAFEWNDGVAAREHRLWQARRLIAIHVRSEDGTPEVISLRFDRGKPGGGYRSMSDVLADRDLRKMALDEAIADLEHWQQRHETLRQMAELAAVNREIDRTRKRRGKAKPKRREERPAA